jgi:hypothetical protein
MIRIDGTKAPIESWERWQDEIPSAADIDAWFGDGKQRGIGMICGAVSGNLEAIDLDDPTLIDDFEQKVNYDLPNLLNRLVVIQTPRNGRHYLYRVEAEVGGNQKLAMKLVDGEVKCRIETRGEGGYTVAPGSPARCHKAGQPYLLVHGHYSNLPVLSVEVHEKLLNCARYFNEYTPPVATAEKEKRTGGDLRPGDDFSDQANAEWVARILEHAGWQLVYRSRRGHQQWTRPGKDRKDGTSATLFDSGVFHVFSSNAHPFEPDRDYSPFDVLSLLTFGGDFAACARALAKKGYGSQQRRVA